MDQGLDLEPRPGTLCRDEGFSFQKNLGNEVLDDKPNTQSII